jgi:hypothetical protein
MAYTLSHGLGGTADSVFSGFKIGDLELGSTPMQAEPSPRRVVWKKKNRVTTHEIPGAKDKTQRTSVTTLWTLSVTMRTLKSDSRDKLLKMIDEVGPWLVEDSAFKILQMYITDAEATRIEAEDETVVEWNLTLLECYD